MSGMCSVEGCQSGLRGVQRFRLPEDPERRLKWVQFLAIVNKQRFKESSWTDIKICKEHFEDDCFENLIHSAVTGRLYRTLKSSAVPSLCLQSESKDSDPRVERLREEPVGTKHEACLPPVPKEETSDCIIAVHGQMRPKNENFDSITDNACLPHTVKEETSDCTIAVHGQIHPENENFDACLPPVPKEENSDCTIAVHGQIHPENENFDACLPPVPKEENSDCIIAGHGQIHPKNENFDSITDDACLPHTLKDHGDLNPHCEKSRLTSTAAQGNLVPKEETSDCIIAVHGQMHPKNENFDSITDDACLPHTLKDHGDPNPHCEKSRLTLTAAQGNLVPKEGTSDCIIAVHGQMHPKNENSDACLPHTLKDHADPNPHCEKSRLTSTAAQGNLVPKEGTSDCTIAVNGQMHPKNANSDACLPHTLKDHVDPNPHCEKSRLTSTAAQGNLVPKEGTSDCIIAVHGQMHPGNENFDLITKKTALARTKGKYAVNEKLLLQLFSCDCPLCGSATKVEKIINGVLIALKQRCLQCEYRNEWKSQVNASVPAAEGQHLTKGKYVVNEKLLLQLFSCDCPLCGSATKVEKIINGGLIVLKQRCLQCEYRNEWKSQVNASVPAAEGQHLTEGTDGTADPQLAEPRDGPKGTGAPEIVVVIGGESGAIDETEESSDDDSSDSDEDWKPRRPFLKAEVQNDCPPLVLHTNLSTLCTECGKFFTKRRHHTCEHKMKPYSCNICGKRLVSEAGLRAHCRIHHEKYEHCCKFCHNAFRTKAEKIKHQQIHVTEEKPFKCPDCPQTFAKYKERSIHLEDHRGSGQIRCNLCGIEFSRSSYLRHLAVHTGERAFECSVCHRGFNQMGHLKSHMRLHTGEKPYKCKHCDECFNHNVSLKNHVQRYHASISGCDQEKEKSTERESDACDGDKRGTESDCKEEEVEREETDVPKNKRSTGKPKGRPKKSTSGNIVLAGQEEGQCSGNPQAQKPKRKRCGGPLKMQRRNKQIKKAKTP